MPGLFGTVVIPSAVAHELAQLEAFGFDIAEIRDADWLSIKFATDKTSILIFSLSLDLGESEAISLAEELHSDYLLMDERKGRRIAKERGLKTVGIAGVLLMAKSHRLIPAVGPILQLLEMKAGFWISSALKKEILDRAGEVSE